MSVLRGSKKSFCARFAQTDRAAERQPYGAVVTAPVDLRSPGRLHGVAGITHHYGDDWLED